MNLKLVVGTVLFVIGLIAAVGGIANVGQSDVQREPPFVVEGNRSTNLAERQWAFLPWIAGFSLAVGGALIGLSVGNFNNPRVHLEPGDAVVDPEGYRKMKHV
jgi:hypothetical protein